MSEKKKGKPAPKPDTKADKKTSETVHLSAEDLRKISGGARSNTPPPKTNPSPLPVVSEFALLGCSNSATQPGCLRLEIDPRLAPLDVFDGVQGVFLFR